MAAKTRVNITVDSETLRLADRLARARKISRSAVLRQGVHALASEHNKQQAEADLREQRRKAIEGIRRIAQEFGDWPAEQIVHDMRYRLDGARD